MSTTAKLGLSYWLPGTSSPQSYQNDAVTRLDLFASNTVKSRTTAAQPGSPTVGDAYILPASPTGTDWAGFTAGDLVQAIRDATGTSITYWARYTPVIGLPIVVQDTNPPEIVAWDGTAYEVLAIAPDATLTALAAANWALNSIPIGTGADTLSQVAFAANTFPARASTGNVVAKPITDFALSILDDVDDTAVQATLGLGTIAKQNANAVAITGGTINSTAVGATTPSTGAFTTVSASEATSLATSSGNVMVGSGTAGAKLDVLGVSGGTIPLQLRHSAFDVLGEFLRIARSDSPTVRYHSFKATHSFTPATNRVGLYIHNASTDTAQTEIQRWTTSGTEITGAISATTTVKPGSYTVATVPSASASGAGANIYVTNEVGGAVLATSDATNWRRSTDRAVIS